MQNLKDGSLCRRHNLISEAAPISLFWVNPPPPHFKQANHGTYSNPGTQVGAQNRAFSAVSLFTAVSVKRCIGKGPRKSSFNQIIDKDEQEVASGKQYVRHACSQDKLEFKVFLALGHP